MSHSFHNADRTTHAKVIFAAILSSTVALFCLTFGSGTSVNTMQRAFKLGFHWHW